MTTTTVDDDTPVVTVEFDRPWSEEVLPLDALRVDHHYQRDPKTTLINAIGAAYDLALSGYIVVNRRKSGHYYVIDGQQRMLGAMKAGETEILARVFEGWDRKTEAQYYEALNDTQPQNTHERFKAAYCAGDPPTLHIHRVVHSFGASIYGVDGRREDSIAAIAALHLIYQQGGDIGLSRVLSIVRRAFDEVSRTTTYGSFLKAIWYFIDRHEEADDRRLVTRIQATGMVALKQRAVARAIGTPNATGFYMALLDTYNYKLAERHKLNPVFRRS